MVLQRDGKKVREKTGLKNQTGHQTVRMKKKKNSNNYP